MKFMSFDFTQAYWACQLWDINITIYNILLRDADAVQHVFLFDGAELGRWGGGLGGRMRGARVGAVGLCPPYGGW
jgi:hypothetical protein